MSYQTMRAGTKKSSKRKGKGKWFFLFLLIVTAIACWGFLKMYPIQYRKEINQYAKEFGLETGLVSSIIHTESRYRADAVSPRDAKGLMQLTDQTGAWGAEQLGVEGFQTDLLFDPDTNIRLGCWYIAKLIDQYGNVDTALAAYNAGSGNVSGWLQETKYSLDGVTLSNIPFGETRRYVDKVKETKKIYIVVDKIVHLFE